MTKIQSSVTLHSGYVAKEVPSLFILRRCGPASKNSFFMNSFFAVLLEFRVILKVFCVAWLRANIAS